VTISATALEIREPIIPVWVTRLDVARVVAIIATANPRPHFVLALTAAAPPKLLLAAFPILAVEHF